MAETKSDKLNRLFKECNLASEDVHKHKHYTIITRSGIEKIQAQMNIEVRYNIQKISEKHDFVIIKANGVMGEKFCETFGEASPANNKNSYPIAMAEKRALSRVVLKLAGLYAEGVFGEDEADDFKATVNKTAKAVVKKLPLGEKAYEAMKAAMKTDIERVRAAIPKYNLTEEQAETFKDLI